MTGESTPSSPDSGLGPDESFRAIFLGHPVPTWVCREPGLAIVEVNHAAERRYGYSRDEFLEMTLADLRIDAADPPSPGAGSVKGDGRIGESERHRCKDGRLIEVSVSEHPIVFGGRPARIVSAQATLPGQAADRLTRSETRFRRALENIPDVVVVYDRDLTIQYINEATRRVSGRPTSDFIGFRDEEIWPPAVSEAYLPALRQARETRQMVSVEAEIALPAGARFLEITCVPLLDQEGRVQEILGITHDATEDRRAAAALRSSEARFRDMFESANVGKSMTRPSGRLRANAAFAEMLGYSREELSGMTWQQVTPAEDIAPAEAILAELRSGERDSARLIKRFLRKDGAVVWADVSAVARRKPDGALDYLITTVVDITERRALEERLKASAQLFSDAFHLGPAGMAITRAADGRLLDVNEYFLRTFGFSRDEVVGRTAVELDVFTEEAHQALIDRHVAAGGLRDSEVRARSKSGKAIALLLSSRPVELDGEPCRVSVFVDVTELREARRREREAVRAGNVGLWDWDLRADRVYYSPEWKLQIGYQENEISDDPDEWRDRLHPEDRDRCIETVRAFLDSPDARFETEFRFRHKDGSYRHILANGSLLLDEAGEPSRVVGSHIDVTEQKQLQEQFLHAQKMETVGRLAGGVAHDFNNLLTVINGTAELIASALPATDPLQADLDEIRRAGDRAALLTGQLLAFSRKQVLRLAVVDVNTVVDDLRGMLQRLVGEAVALRLDLDSTACPVEADRGQIEQVILNLVVNARDAMPGGGTIGIATRNVELGGEASESRVRVEPGHYVRLSVSDTGVGMDEATRARVFEPFFTTKESGKGTGLGLSTAYGIVRQSDGDLQVESEPGRGTTLSAYLPRSDESPDGKAEPPPSELAPGVETVLVVEDDDAVRSVASRALEAAGYRVLTAAGGAEALQLLEELGEPVDLMLTDVVMPGMNGRELADRARVVRPGIEVLLSSGYTDDEVVRHSAVGDATHFIAKPYTVVDLARKVRSLLDR